MKAKPNNQPRHSYNQEYFDKHLGPIPYRWEEPHWLNFFNNVAEEIVRVLGPKTVLDVGCAVGFLVEALHRRRVQAYGIDISEYAISQVPQDLRPFCHVASAVEPLPRDIPPSYDLITCIEVLEHMPQAEGK